MSTTSNTFREQNTRSLYDYRTGTVSSGPQRYLTNNPYYRIRATGFSNYGYGTLASAVGILDAPKNTHALAKSKAYDKFMDSIQGPTSQLGSSIGEWSSSLDMVANRAIQLRGAIRAFRRGEIKKAANLLAVPPDAVRNAQRRVSKTHYLSSLWLETYFGWIPLMGDISDSLEVLSEPIRNPVKVKGRASVPYHQTIAGHEKAFVSKSGVVRGSFYGEVEVTNHNLFLANRMGLINPASIAWELVPFSFVADWFTNVGQIINSMTDFAGIRLTRSGYAYRSTGSGVIVDTYGSTSARITGSQYLRTPGGIARPPIAYRSPFTGFKRAGTQIALLNAIFIKPR